MGTNVSPCLQVLAEQALKQALDEVAKTKIKRVGVPRETPEHPAYMPLEHSSLDGRAWQTLLATSFSAFRTLIHFFA
jgi:hypothetical protein